MTVRRWVGSHVLVVLSVAALFTLGEGPAVSASEPSYGCGTGFNIGRVDFTTYLALPRTAAAIDEGLVSQEVVLSGLMKFDHNGNEMVCVQLSHGFEVSNKPFGQYMYNVVDDSASVPAS